MRRRLTLLMFASLALAPTPAQAQGWTLPAGDNWIRVGLLLQNTDERYFIDGQRIPYFFDGTNETVGFFLDYRRGLTDRLQLDLQVPYVGITFDDRAANRVSGGIGDVRLTAHYNLLRNPLQVTLGATVKFPTGDFDNDAETIPVGEGQYDFEFQLELARSLWPRPGWVNGFVGYRVRLANEETGIDYGNEIFWSAEVGYEVLAPVTLKVRARGLHGRDSTSFGLPIPTLNRAAVYLEPGTLIRVSAVGTVELTIPISLSGRNWPAGPLLLLGYFQQF